MTRDELEAELKGLVWSLDQWTSGNLRTIESGAAVTPQLVIEWRRRIDQLRIQLTAYSPLEPD
ncbi:hypothetical protein [Acidisoma sp. L85]|uniref:hypothetical protein n=1 Tax=Acidisoma sp. L85 TaxID=1641850 RepID=UPI00131B5BE5|nr:hypothetical protein [Acidisoma sp. L85]